MSRNASLGAFTCQRMTFAPHEASSCKSSAFAPFVKLGLMQPRMMGIFLTASEYSHLKSWGSFATSG